MNSISAAERVRKGSPSTARRLIVAWQHPATRLMSPVGVLEFDGQRYSFVYLQRALAVKDFRPLLGFQDLHRRYESAELFPLFSQRVMTPSRPDYARYVTRLGLDADEYSPWEQMARSGGARQGDTLQLFPVPSSDGTGMIRCAMLVHGIRHMSDRQFLLGDRTVYISRADHESALQSLSKGDPVRLIPEPTNAANTSAVIVASESRIPLGYLPDLLTEDFARLSESANVDGRVLRANDSDAPAHMRLLIELTATPSQGFEFFAGDEWPLLA